MIKYQSYTFLTDYDYFLSTFLISSMLLGENEIVMFDEICKRNANLCFKTQINVIQI